ncbi:MAG: hypothetical protein HUU23_09545 [Caldilineales bacterium]|nr:hypothetical protein [Caldilineales bacterium]
MTASPPAPTEGWRSELARRVAGSGRAWLSPGVDPIAELIEDRVREDEEEGLTEAIHPSSVYTT